MAEYHADASCAAPAREVWKLLYDPTRFASWWPGWERVESAGGGAVTRYDDRWPDFAYPTSVVSDPSHGRIVVSCLLSDIEHTWRIDPDGPGCRVGVRVVVPDAEAARTDDVVTTMRTALAALIARAERP
jgi:hypothetical protein